MEQQIKEFFFVLSIIYSLKFVFEFLMRFREENPEPIEIHKVDKVFLYFTTAYIITYILI
jgi:hypothetical protein